MSDSLHPVDCGPLGSSVHGILQARILEWVVMASFSTQGGNPGLPLKADSLLLSHNEISPHTSQNGHHQKVYKQWMLERVWGEMEPSCTAGGKETDTTTMKDGMQVP